jgi:hypothetical protein
MWPRVVALALLVLGVAMGVVGNWLKPPARMSARTIVAIFAVLLVLAAGVTFVNAEAEASNGPSTPVTQGPEATTSAPLSAAPLPSTTRGGAPSTTTGMATASVNRPSLRSPQTSRPPAKAQPCLVGSWSLTSIVDYISHSDEKITMSYDSGWETRTYKAEGTFMIANNWREIGYDNTLNELQVHSNGTAEGRYKLAGSTVTYDPVNSVGNWTLTFNGEVTQQASVIFSRGEETITCTSDSLKVVAGGSYKASYARK